MMKKGQFYILASFIVGMYIFFILRMFTATKTSFEVPEIPQVTYIHEAAQHALNEEGSIKAVKEAINYIPEPVGLRCNSMATGEGSCDLYEDEWSCGVNVTVVYRGSIDLEVTQGLYKQNFDIESARIPVYILPNASANLVKLSQDVGISQGTLKDTSGDTIKGSWSGTTVSFRVNLVKNRPKVIQVYQSGSNNYNLYEDVGVLDEGSFDSSVLYNKLSSKKTTENLTFSDLDQIKNGAGPIILFIPGAYPDSYGSVLRSYVSQGGVIVAPYGLCRVSSGACLVGNIETISGGSLEGIGDFATLNPINSGSDYFTNTDTPWIVYDNSGTNTSRAAIGATSYEEGYVVFVGNESMLSTWSQLDSFLTEVINWGIPTVSTTKSVCPTQIP